MALHSATQRNAIHCNAKRTQHLLKVGLLRLEVFRAKLRQVCPAVLNSQWLSMPH
jgi:hypothetical protein